MIVQLSPPLGRGAPLTLQVSQLVVLDDQGAPLAAALEYGPPGCYCVAHLRDAEFPRVLKSVGFEPPQVQTVKLPPF